MEETNAEGEGLARIQGVHFAKKSAAAQLKNGNENDNWSKTEPKDRSKKRKKPEYNQ